MFFRMAVRNVKRQVGNYLIYFMTVAFTVALLFAVDNVIFGEQVAGYMASSKETAQDFKYGLGIGVAFICMIVAFVLGYATLFMLKLRKREFGTYLTMGMTRRNVLSLFILETMVICMLALGLGIVLGLFIYQGLMAVIMHLMEMEFAFSAYSPRGLVFTVVLVVWVFLLASVTSAFYLRRVRIYDLIHAEKKVEKAERHPVFWLLVMAGSLLLIVLCCAGFYEEIDQIMINEGSYGSIMNLLAVFGCSLIFFHIGFARSIVYLLMKQKRFCNRGTNTFVLRQLSGTLRSNSVMIGMLAFLLTFAVIGSDAAFVQRAGERARLNYEYPFDISYHSDRYGDGITGKSAGISLDQAETVIQKYAPIIRKRSYKTYTSHSSDLYSYTKWSGEGYDGLNDSFMKESDFNKLLTAVGMEPLELDGGFFVIANNMQAAQYGWDGVQLELNGRTYECRGMMDDCPLFHFVYIYAVVPDEAVKGMEEECRFMAYDLAHTRFDAPALKKELSYQAEKNLFDGETRSYSRCDFTIKEYGRHERNSVAAILVVGALFAASIFLFLAMAILALKTLSGIADDRRRYQILFRIGAGARDQRRALFRQTFSFFLMPFLFSMLAGIPSAVVCERIMVLGGAQALSGQVYVIAGSVAFVMVCIYTLYYIMTYLIAKRSVLERV